MRRSPPRQEQMSEPRGDISSIPEDVLPPEGREEYALALAQLIAGKRLDAQIRALKRDNSSTDKRKPGPPSKEEKARFIHAQLYPEGTQGRRKQDVRDNLSKELRKYGVILGVRQLARYTRDMD
jgi:hypothetical protein